MKTYTTKETAAALRTQLRTTWPGVKFSVRCATGTAYGWMRVAWVDGPDDDQVRAVCNHYESERFDGMTDSYQQQPDPLVVTTPGELPEMVRYSCCGINTERVYTDEATRIVLRAFVAENPEVATAFDIDGIDIDTLVYNDLHRDARLMRLDNLANSIVYRGDHIPRYLPDLGTTVAAALQLTDFTTTATDPAA
ncbi:LPD29 domain-containing protein [Gordonia soli]|uniref:Large polyvalent protein associated domain-containing protein n=1 Tax=Gordonia soli NBRC 108243 TaxID=1223545 RepID=M0QMC1_9ACTN|nr:LPD29 domain-containing protein [Gordonia soli]GAC69564.1 hypothetical protein GS4_26_00110 [Gordonia soli NBRC 108243]